MFTYIRDAAEIYEKSFAQVRDATDLSGFSSDQADVVVRLVHATAMPEIAADLVFSEHAVRAGSQALESARCRPGSRAASPASRARADRSRS